jgi:hypothetical protein
MSKSRNLVQFCKIILWLEQQDKDLASAVTNLCAGGLLHPSSSEMGVTFLYPKNARIRQDVIDQAYSSSAGEALRKIKSWIIPLCLKTADDFKNATIGTRNNTALKVENISGSTVKLAGGATLTPAASFIPLTRQDIAVWEMEGTTPITGESFRKPMKKRETFGDRPKPKRSTGTASRRKSTKGGGVFYGGNPHELYGGDGSDDEKVTESDGFVIVEGHHGMAARIEPHSQPALKQMLDWVMCDPGNKIHSNLGNIPARTRLAYSLERKFDVEIQKPGDNFQDPYLLWCLGFMKKLETSAPDTLFTMLAFFDYNPLVFFYIVIQPYKFSSPHIVPEELIDQYSEEFFVGPNPKTEYIRFSRIVRNREMEGQVSKEGFMPAIFEFPQRIVQATESIRSKLLAPSEIDRVTLVDGINHAYTEMCQTNTLGDLSNIYPHGALKHMKGREQIARDEFRFLIGLSTMSYYTDRNFYDQRDFCELLSTLRTLRSGDDVSRELGMTHPEYWASLVSPKTAHDLLVSFTASLDFLHAPLPSNHLGSHWGSLHKESSQSDMRTGNTVLERHNSLLQLPITHGLPPTTLSSAERDKFETFTEQHPGAASIDSTELGVPMEPTPDDHPTPESIFRQCMADNPNNPGACQHHRIEMTGHTSTHVQPPEQSDEPYYESQQEHHDPSDLVGNEPDASQNAVTHEPERYQVDHSEPFESHHDPSDEVYEVDRSNERTDDDHHSESHQPEPYHDDIGETETPFHLRPVEMELDTTETSIPQKHEVPVDTDMTEILDM